MSFSIFVQGARGNLTYIDSDEITPWVVLEIVYDLISHNLQGTREVLLEECSGVFPRFDRFQIRKGEEQCQGE